MIAVLMCVALTLPMTALAEETTTTTKSDVTTTTAPGTTKDSKTTTTSSQKPTTTAAPQKIATSLTITYEHRVITIRVTDANGKAVEKATVAVSVDGAPSSLVTNSSGVATLSVASDPMEVRASMAAFQNAKYAYEAAQASVVLQTTQAPVSTAPTTAAPSEDKTTSPRNTTTLATRSLTTTDPAAGDITQIVTVTGTTVTEPSDGTDDAKTVGFAAGKWAWVLIVVGVVLVLAAIAILVVFLVRRPRDPDEEDAEDDESEETADADEDMFRDDDPEAEEAYETSEDDPVDNETEEPKNTGVSLEDLFRK